MKFCPACGLENPDHFRFCGDCHAVLSHAENLIDGAPAAAGLPLDDDALTPGMAASAVSLYSWWRLLIAACALAVLLVGILYLSGVGREAPGPTAAETEERGNERGLTAPVPPAAPAEGRTITPDPALPSQASADHQKTLPDGDRATPQGTRPMDANPPAREPSSAAAKTAPASSDEVTAPGKGAPSKPALNKPAAGPASTGRSAGAAPPPPAYLDPVDRERIIELDKPLAADGPIVIPHDR